MPKILGAGMRIGANREILVVGKYPRCGQSARLGLHRHGAVTTTVPTPAWFFFLPNTVFHDIQDFMEAMTMASDAHFTRAGERVSVPCAYHAEF